MTAMMAVNESFLDARCLSNMVLRCFLDDCSQSRSFRTARGWVSQSKMSEDQIDCRARDRNERGLLAAAIYVATVMAAAPKRTACPIKLIASTV